MGFSGFAEEISVCWVGVWAGVGGRGVVGHGGCFEVREPLCFSVFIVVVFFCPCCFKCVIAEGHLILPQSLAYDFFFYYYYF